MIINILIAIIILLILFIIILIAVFIHIINERNRQEEQLVNLIGDFLRKLPYNNNGEDGI